jgi:putative phosphoesterase
MTLMLVFSDTHGSIILAEQAIARFPQAMHILHLGDYTRDARLLEARYPNKAVLAVSGNCDYEGDTDKYPSERVLVIENKRILLVHGNRFHVKGGYDKLFRKAEKDRFDLVLFGHTHIAADITQNGRHIFNPGSPTLPVGNEGPTYGIVEIGRGLIETRIMEQ